MKQLVKQGFKCPYHECCVGSVLCKRCESFIELEYESDSHGRMEAIVIDCKLDLHIKRHLNITEDIIFTYSGLGQPFFLHENAIDCRIGISPRDWTVEELRKIADYMESNPNCKTFSDGSGL